MAAISRYWRKPRAIQRWRDQDAPAHERRWLKRELPDDDSSQYHPAHHYTTLSGRNEAISINEQVRIYGEFCRRHKHGQHFAHPEWKQCLLRSRVCRVINLAERELWQAAPQHRLHG